MLELARDFVHRVGISSRFCMYIVLELARDFVNRVGISSEKGFQLHFSLFVLSAVTSDRQSLQSVAIIYDCLSYDNVQSQCEAIDVMFSNSRL